MAFPTIPSGSQILASYQADTTATRTGPSFSSLTFSAGDLIVAICAAYACPVSNASFSGWSHSLAERVDVGNSATPTMAIGIATKIATGSETGAFTVTQAATVVGHAAMILMAIPGAHATTAIEATALASGTTSAADPAALTPTWGAADTLWVSVLADGEVSATGTWTGCGGAPANYTGFADCAVPDNSVVGQADCGVSFRQVNAASENAGTGTVDTSNARNAALVFAVRPAAAVLSGDVAVPVTAAAAPTGALVLASGTQAVALTAGVSAGGDVQSSFPAQDIAWQGAGFGLSLPGGSTVSEVRVTVRHHESSVTEVSALTAQIYVGGTPVGSPASLTRSLTDRTDDVAITTGVAGTDVPDLAVRVTGHVTTAGATVFIDTAYCQVAFEPGTGANTWSGDVTRALTAGATSTGEVARLGQAATAATAGVSAAGVSVFSSAVTAAGTAAVSADATAVHPGGCTAGITAGVTADGTVGAAAKTGDVAVAQTAGVTAAGRADPAGQLTVPVTAGVSTAGGLTLGSGTSVPVTAGVSVAGAVGAVAVVAATAGVSAAGTVTHPVAATVAATAGASADGTVARLGQASVPVTAGVSAASAGTYTGEAVVAVTAGVSVAGSTGAIALVTATAGVSAAATVIHPAGVAVAQTATVSADGVAVHPAAAAVAVTAGVAAVGLVGSNLARPVTAGVSAAGVVARPSGCAVALAVGVSAAGAVTLAGQVPVTVTVTVISDGLAAPLTAVLAGIWAGRPYLLWAAGPGRGTIAAAGGPHTEWAVRPPHR